MPDYEREDLETLLGPQAHRLVGVTWGNVAFLGRANVERILELARANVVAEFNAGEDRQVLRSLRRGVDALERVLAETMVDKPVLPRLRNELFRERDRVRVYMGDTPGVAAGSGWAVGEVIQVRKGYREQWDDGSPNGGYHWRVTVDLWMEGGRGWTVAFSTTEPRAVLEDDWPHLLQASRDDPVFWEAYVANAYRPWQPLWVSEAGRVIDAGAMNFAAWIRDSVAPS